MAEWQYDDRPGVRRFRDARTGRFLAVSKALDLRDGFQERRRVDLDRLVRRLADGELTVQAWEAEMRAAVRQVHAAEYAYGRGGLDAMTAADWRVVDEIAAEQWGYLRGFAEDVSAGRLSEAQIGARARLYAASARTSYERGRASAFGVALPAYPGQGTDCGANCRCSWRIVEADDEYRCTWVRHATDSCETCRSRAARWAPLVIARPSDGRMARLYRVVA